MRIANVLALGLVMAAFPALSQDMAKQTTAGEQWDARFDKSMYLYGTEPVEFLRSHIGGLPKGKALCLAAGEGRNAVFLAEQGFEYAGVGIQHGSA